MKKFLKKIKPDVVISAGSYLCPGTWKVASLKKKIGYKAYFWSESHLGEVRNFGGVKIRIREKLRKSFYKKYDGFLCPGKLAFSFVNKYASEDAKKIQLPNLVDETVYTKKLSGVNPLCEKLHKEGKIILFIPARLTEVKGIGPFLELISKVKNKSMISLIVAGEGKLLEQLKSMAKTLGVEVFFLGPKKQDEVAALYKYTDIFALPSISDASPLTCIEALWSKKPLLVSNHVGNYPEVISQGQNGYMFSYDHKNEAISIIESLTSKDADWLKKAGDISYDIAMKIYDSRKTVKRVKEELCNE